MRTARITADGPACYHCISRIIEQRYILDHAEKHALHKLMRRVEAFCGVHVLTYVIMSSHFHILLLVPPREELSDSQLLERLGWLYRPEEVKDVARTLENYRRDGLNSAADELKARYACRMYDVSEFIKTLKQRFSQRYNRRNGRLGTLWAGRFKSLLVEKGPTALLAVGAYIDLNPVRARLTPDPADYRFCGYGEAMGGSRCAREGLKSLLETGSWSKARRLYREHLFEVGRQRVDHNGRTLRGGFAPEQIRRVLDAGGELPMRQLLRCRVKYFTDGLVLGSKDFVENVLKRCRDQPGLRRRAAAEQMRFGQWNGLCTLRKPRCAVALATSG